MKRLLIISVIVGAPFLAQLGFPQTSTPTSVPSAVQTNVLPLLKTTEAVYTNVVFISRTPVTVTFRHVTGVATVDIRQLSPDFQALLEYDPQRASAGSAPVQEARPKPQPQYDIVKRWSIPNGGEGKVIVIPPAVANEKGMTALADKLREDTRLDRNAFVFIFDNTKAAEMRDRLNSLTPTELEFYERHYVGTYTRNANTGYHEMDMHPSGINGAMRTLKF